MKQEFQPIGIRSIEKDIVFSNNTELLYFMATNTIALLISYSSGSPVLETTLFDEWEIQLLEAALVAQEPEPMKHVHNYRTQEQQKELELADFVEELVSKPFLSSQIQHYGMQWFKSKIKIDEYNKLEQDAIQVIAKYAFQLFLKDSHKTDYFLLSPNSRVRVRVFILPSRDITQAG
jgi:hypothetical protein